MARAGQRIALIVCLMDGSDDGLRAASRRAIKIVIVVNFSGHSELLLGVLGACLVMRRQFWNVLIVDVLEERHVRQVIVYVVIVFVEICRLIFLLHAVTLAFERVLLGRRVTIQA